MGQGSPLAPGAVQVQNGIDHFTHLGGSGVSSWLGGRDQRFKDPPLVVGHITGIASSLHLSTSSLPFSFVTLPLLYHLAGVLAEPLSKPIYRLVLSHLASQAFAHSLLGRFCEAAKLRKLL